VLSLDQPAQLKASLLERLQPGTKPSVQLMPESGQTTKLLLNQLIFQFWQCMLFCTSVHIFPYKESLSQLADFHETLVC
jgi:hypothetical protein